MPLDTNPISFLLLTLSYWAYYTAKNSNKCYRFCASTDTFMKEKKLKSYLLHLQGIFIFVPLVFLILFVHEQQFRKVPYSLCRWWWIGKWVPGSVKTFSLLKLVVTFQTSREQTIERESNFFLSKAKESKESYSVFTEYLYSTRSLSIQDYNVQVLGDLGSCAASNKVWYLE